MSDHNSAVLELENRLRFIVDELGWNYEELEKEKNSESLANCPLNRNHRLPQKCMEGHLISCSWKSAGYNSEDIPLPENPSASYSLQLTKDLQAEILENAAAENPSFVLGGDFRREIPQTAYRLQQDFTQDERRVIYDYVVSKTKRKAPSLHVTIGELAEEDGKKEMTALEVAQAVRDAKRRRATYRNKVHTNRKSHIEVLRDVIESQMNHMNKPVEEQPNEETNRRDLENTQSGRDEHSIEHGNFSDRGDMENAFSKPWHSSSRDERSREYGNFRDRGGMENALSKPFQSSSRDERSMEHGNLKDRGDMENAFSKPWHSSSRDERSREHGNFRDRGGMENALSKPFQSSSRDERSMEHGNLKDRGDMENAFSKPWQSSSRDERNIGHGSFRDRGDMGNAFSKPWQSSTRDERTKKHGNYRDRAFTSYRHRNEEKEQSSRYKNDTKEKYEQFDITTRIKYSDNSESEYHMDYGEKHIELKNDRSRRESERHRSSHNLEKGKRKKERSTKEKKHKHKRKKERKTEEEHRHKKSKKRRKGKSKSRSKSRSSSTS